MKKIDNKGFTLVETLLCFVILGIILVIASQIIHSSTEVYYYNRSMSYGIQASQIVATEIRGEIEDALPLQLVYECKYSDYYVYVDSVSKSIEFIGCDGKQVKLSLEKENGGWVLHKYLMNVYDINTMERPDDESTIASLKYSEPIATFDSKYIGMGYEIKDINFKKFEKMPVPTTIQIANEKDRYLMVGNYPVIEMTIKVGNNQYDDYECKEYIALYNFYGLVNDSDSYDKIINIQ